jgi:signal transduction histidine kinase
MNIRSRLIQLIMSVLLPAFIAGAVAVWYVYFEQQRDQERSLSEAARVLAQLIDNELESSEKFLLALSASPELKEGNLERFYQHVRSLSESGRSAVVLSTLDGKQLLNTRLPWGAPAVSSHARLNELRRNSGDSGRTLVSDLYYSTLGKSHDFAVQVPVTLNGAPRYYLARGIEAASLQRFLGRQGFPESWVASVVDRDGTVVARSVNPQEFIGKRATGTMAAKIRAGMREGVNDGTTLDGTRVKAFFHRAPFSDWTVILSVPVKELSRPALQASVLLTTLILLTFIGAMFVIQRNLGRILAPVERLRDDADRLGRGEQISQFASGLQELDVINAALVNTSTELRQARADMERRVAEAIESTERAERALLHSQKLEALGRLTGGVAHDFNNVLQSLTSALQLIGLDPHPDKLPDRLAVCDKAVARATSLVAQLRAFGRIQDAYLQTIRVDEAVASALPMLRNCLPSAIQFDTSMEPGEWPVTVDPTQFELALLNLVLNARDAIPGQGLIALHVGTTSGASVTGLAPDGEYVCITIADTGAGMPPEVLARAFDPFFTTKSVDRGSGLGLPQAYGFAIQSGGTLVLASIVGTGTSARLYLPRAAQAAPQVEQAQQADEVLPTLDTTVLFVEDDNLVRESVAPILERTGARVVCARSGDEALAILAERDDIDVVFTDIVMPGKINGLTLARLVRERFPGMGIMLATGYSEEQYDLPGVAMLTKPYQAKDAIKVLARIA